MSVIRTLQDVVDWNLCIGCGACFFACKKNAVELVNIENTGIRPVFHDASCASCTDCLSFCPGAKLDIESREKALPADAMPDPLIGATLGIHEGYATDPELRHHGSSGGVISALALYCIERENMAFVMHTGMDEIIPWLNKTLVSRTRRDIIRNAGSRYATSSPCDSLHLIEESDRPCVFVGKPCDVAAVNELRKVRPELDRKLGLVLSFFCAGTPSTHGTLELIDGFELDRGSVRDVRYRGEGWPGNFRVAVDGREDRPSMTYLESWGKMQRYRPLRCHLCPDSLGEFSDITSGDAWHRYDGSGKNEGLSLILIRSPRGREIFTRACRAGYLTTEPAGANHVVHAQGVLSRRRQLFGRLLARRMAGIPSPELRGFHLFSLWMDLPVLLRAKTVLGTLRRIFSRGLRRRTRSHPGKAPEERKHAERKHADQRNAERENDEREKVENGRGGGL